MATAEAPKLALPVECTIGQTCFVEDYVDADPGPGQRDYTCGLKSRNDHRGTDFMLLGFEDMARGVNVIASAPGRVSATRDGMDDVPVTEKTREAIRGRECGNAVRIDHGDGWQTLYCHMKKNSLTVAQGDTVVSGDILGQIGLSGLTNAPHVHLGVLHEGLVVDPFNPTDRDTCGLPSGDSLWESTFPYDRAGLFTAGFSTAVPTFDAVKSGAARVSSARSDQPLVLYGHVFHAEPEDHLILSAIGPDGEIFRKEVTLEDPSAQLYRAYGRKAPSAGWPDGAYRGYVRLMRDNKVLAVRHADITVGAR
ncbi:M23 family metallopeptidase [uncultured Roseovarius sp.]|uniref:M23 family metallopeptidase n=1 Tax=uncultured Roseovarius sp. TaxID=293344 RepID=UPI0026059F1E|nr:M23 family metallopeptidase [uncultured Roseovarius sp.]